MSHPLAYPAGRVLLQMFLMLVAGLACAGGGPENVFLVVNGNSVNSLTIANHFIKLRAIPPGNVVMLPWDTKVEATDIDTFRNKILDPVLKTIEQRCMVAQIDYIVYSSDFPTAIHLGSDVEKFKATAAKELGDKAPKDWPQILSPVGSLNGMTFLWQPVKAQSSGYFEQHVNYYARRGDEKHEPTTMAFQSTKSWTPEGKPVDEPGRRYLLSMMLGVTSGRGNTVDEVVRYLARSAAADGTHPSGTIYFMKNTNVRSTVRHQVFPEAVRALKALKINAEIVDGILPMNKPDVQGAVIGASDFNWASSKSTILPGALCEHFTSYGGMMAKDAGQTPLSEFLRYGAAGASGTVTEPYAIFEKFPSPMIQVYYARGCTLAEAFYQSVSAPYQLLIVGDPLCRPWANIPIVSVEGAASGATVQGTLKLKPSAKLPSGGKIDHFELFVDEKRCTGCEVGGELRFDTALMGDGFHELRVVAFEAGNIRSQGRVILPLLFNNRGRTVEATLEPHKAGQPIGVRVKAPGALGILVLNNAQMVGKVAGADGRVEIAESTVGRGPVRLRVVALGDGNPQNYAYAKPLEIDIK